MSSTTITNTDFTNVNPESSKFTFSSWLYFTISSYLILYCLNGQFVTYFAFQWFWDLVVPPFASLFREEGFVRTVRTGSGDLIFNYYQLLLFMILSVISGTVLSFLMKKKSTVDKFKIGTFMLVKYFVVFQMILYGLAKIFYLQFQFPTDMDMDKKLGDMSPMGLLWTFMGYSKGYTMFTGWLEFIGGVLLLFRRSMMLGALMSVGVMLNVMMLNFCYDVPVKLLSSHVVLLCIFLLAPGLKSAYQYFFTNGPVERAKFPLFDYKSSGKVFIGFKIGLLLIAIGGLMYGFIADGSLEETGPPAFKNIHHVSNFTEYDENGTAKDSFQTTYRWKAISDIDGTSLVIKYENDELRWLRMSVTNAKDTLKLREYRDSVDQHLLIYKDSLEGHYHISGQFFEDSISMDWTQSKDSFLLKTRKFHWVQEYAFNR